ncbi:MAG: hypothetical protein ACKO23_05145 [Gemmataceae bacterium]
MPIRFRCHYCHQLLGIARRKAGSMVRCPTCQNELTVPSSSGSHHSEPVVQPSETRPSSRKEPGLFDRDDFDDLLRPGQPPYPSNPFPLGGPPSSSGAFSLPHPDGPASSPEGSEPSPAARTFLLTPLRTALLVAAVLVLMGIAFALGLLVGRHLG